jgi:hypothetical protein
MSLDAIDHVQHGWALLALRLPEVRPLAHRRHDIDEMCESYSLAVLALQRFRAGNAHHTIIDDSEEIISEIEWEAAYFLTQFARLSG